MTFSILNIYRGLKKNAIRLVELLASATGAAKRPRLRRICLQDTVHIETQSGESFSMEQTVSMSNEQDTADIQYKTRSESLRLKHALIVLYVKYTDHKHHQCRSVSHVLLLLVPLAERLTERACTV